MRSIVIFSGSAHVELAREICRRLRMRFSPSTVTRFSNDCLGVQLKANCRAHEGEPPAPQLSPAFAGLNQIINAAYLGLTP